MQTRNMYKNPLQSSALP